MTRSPSASSRRLTSDAPRASLIANPRNARRPERDRGPTSACRGSTKPYRVRRSRRCEEVDEASGRLSLLRLFCRLLLQLRLLFLFLGLAYRASAQATPEVPAHQTTHAHRRQGGL